MNKAGKRQVFKAVACLLALGIAAIMLTRCGEVNIDWKEEVRMADGEILLLHRTAKGKVIGGDMLGRAAGWQEKEMTLEALKLPANWAPPPLWRTEYVPILLDYQPQEHTWSVVATFYYCGSWKQLGRPTLPYVEYQSKNGEPWQVIPLEQRLIGRKTNLLTGPKSSGEPARDETEWLRKRIPNYRETPNTVTVEEKDWRGRNAGKKYKSILAVWGGCGSN